MEFNEWIGRKVRYGRTDPRSLDSLTRWVSNNHSKKEILMRQNFQSYLWYLKETSHLQWQVLRSDPPYSNMNSLRRDQCSNENKFLLQNYTTDGI